MATTRRPLAEASDSGMFTRKATGLVREMGGFDAFLMNVIWINLVLGVLLYTLAPAIYPGVNMAWGYALTTVVLVLPILVYAWLAAAMPRSGGEYVYISRIIHPSAGFVFNFLFTVTTILFVSLLSTFVVTTGFSPMFATLGAITGKSSLTTLSADIAKDGWVFVIGLVTIVICCLANWFGLRVLMIFQRVMFAISIVSLAIAAILMLTSSRADFVHDFAKFGNYDQVIAAAGKSGFPVGAHNTVSGLIAFTALGFTVLALSQMPAYAAGELRHPRRNAVISMVGSLLIGGAIFTILAALAQRTFGLDFLGGMTTLSNAGSSSYPSGLPAPFFLLYTGMLTHSTFLSVVMTLGVVTALLGNIALTIMVPTRNMLAWSVDGIIPAWVRKTDARHHAPQNAILLAGGVGVAILIPLVFGPPDLFNFVFSAATMQAIVFTATALAGTLFAYRLPQLFASSPYNRRIGGIPVLTVIGAISTVLYGYFAVKLITDDRVGANSTSGLIAICVGFGLGVVIYVISWWWNRQRGIDLGAIYKELPPE
jgi:amino acid transporter